MDMGRSLFADDRALWKRGENLEHTVKKIQDGIKQAETWETKWGFTFSVMFFIRKNSGKVII